MRFSKKTAIFNENTPQILIVAMLGTTALLIGEVPFVAADVPLNLVSLTEANLFVVLA